MEVILLENVSQNKKFMIFLFDLVDGHDSKEDALACLDLMKQKVTGDVSRLQSQVRANNSSKRRDAYLTDPDSVKLN